MSIRKEVLPREVHDRACYTTKVSLLTLGGRHDLQVRCAVASDCNPWKELSQCHILQWPHRFYLVPYLTCRQSYLSAERRWCVLLRDTRAKDVLAVIEGDRDSAVASAQARALALMLPTTHTLPGIVERRGQAAAPSRTATCLSCHARWFQVLVPVCCQLR